MGVCGALVKEILEDNKLILPRRVDGELCLGFLGGLLVGGFAGFAVDGNPITAFLGGYAGKSIIETLITQNAMAKMIEPKKVPEKTETEAEKILEMIKTIAKKEGVDENLAVRVAMCESVLKPKAIHTNADGSIDRGLYQINSKYHPYVSEKEAFDPEFSIKFFCRAVKNGNISWWNASKQCWDVDKA